MQNKISSSILINIKGYCLYEIFLKAADGIIDDPNMIFTSNIGELNIDSYFKNVKRNSK